MSLRYLIVPAIPLVAIWAFVLAKSAGQFYALVEAAPASPAARPPADLAATEPENRSRIVAEPVQAPPSARTQSAPVESTPIPEPWPDPSYAPSHDYGAPYAYDEAPPAEILHPEVTDPAMRRLLEPAWAD